MRNRDRIQGRRQARVGGAARLSRRSGGTTTLHHIVYILLAWGTLWWLRIWQATSWLLKPTEWFRRKEPAYTGRQQLRAAARNEAMRQLGRAPVSRHVRREAAREVSRHMKGNACPVP